MLLIKIPGESRWHVNPFSERSGFYYPVTGYSQGVLGIIGTLDMGKSSWFKELWLNEHAKGTEVVFLGGFTAEQLQEATENLRAMMPLTFRVEDLELPILRAKRPEPKSKSNLDRDQWKYRARHNPKKK